MLAGFYFPFQMLLWYKIPTKMYQWLLNGELPEENFHRIRGMLLGYSIYAIESFERFQSEHLCSGFIIAMRSLNQSPGNRAIAVAARRKLFVFFHTDSVTITAIATPFTRLLADLPSLSSHEVNPLRKFDLAQYAISYL